MGQSGAQPWLFPSAGGADWRFQLRDNLIAPSSADTASEFAIGLASLEFDTSVMSRFACTNSKTVDRTETSHLTTAVHLSPSWNTIAKAQFAASKKDTRRESSGQSLVLRALLQAHRGSGVARVPTKRTQGPQSFCKSGNVGLDSCPPFQSKTQNPSHPLPHHGGKPALSFHPRPIPNHPEACQQTSTAQSDRFLCPAIPSRDSLSIAAAKDGLLDLGSIQLLTADLRVHLPTTRLHRRPESYPENLRFPRCASPLAERPFTTRSGSLLAPFLVSTPLALEPPPPFHEW
ncbi:hypothetical protein GQ607_011389 [Colletotrichum asianum]|uniref:Uncharacterized protein n=1 Tax=Colletotrichum asianum TaxID=702518 RepID=A0A8H3ZPI4_9PEZI|nr:hypothetical protein GQ607_011389 [Colletotrichum asianum]